MLAMLRRARRICQTNLALGCAANSCVHGNISHNAPDALLCRALSMLCCGIPSGGRTIRHGAAPRASRAPKRRQVARSAPGLSGVGSPRGDPDCAASSSGRGLPHLSLLQRERLGYHPAVPSVLVGTVSKLLEARSKRDGLMALETCRNASALIDTVQYTFVALLNGRQGLHCWLDAEWIAVRSSPSKGRGEQAQPERCACRGVVPAMLSFSLARVMQHGSANGSPIRSPC